MTVALINIPLSISLAVAAQAPPGMGIITATWSGLAAALFGGSQYNIVGPTGALSGILTKYTTEYGASCLPWLSISSAGTIFLAYIFKLHTYATFLPSAVSQGFTLGVAMIIAGGQAAPALGLRGLTQRENFLAQMYELVTHIGYTDTYTLAIFISFWAGLFILLHRWPNVPWSIAIAAGGIGVGALSVNGLLPPLETLGHKFGTLSASLWSHAERNKQLEADVGGVIQGSASIAFVAVLETLISGRIADGLTRTKMDQQQEVLGLSLANLISGMAGGLPATAALARTALNVRSGARTRIAGVISAVLTGAVAMLLLPLFQYLPVSVVSAMLFQVAVGMVETKHLYQAFRVQKSALWLTAAVAFLCLAFDPTVAIVAGSIVGLLAAAAKTAEGYSEVVHSTNVQEAAQSGNEFNELVYVSQPSYWQSIRIGFDRWLGQQAQSASDTLTESVVQCVDIPAHMTDHTVIYRIVGDLTYISSLAHEQRMRALTSRNYLVISLRYCLYVDFDGVITLAEVVADLQKKGIHVCVCAINNTVHRQLVKADWFTSLQAEGKVFNSTAEAVAHIENSFHSGHNRRAIENVP